MLFILASIIIAVLVYYYVIQPMNFWKDLGVPHKKSLPLLGGITMALLRKKSFIDFVQEQYNTFTNLRYYGIHQLNKPILIVRDIDLIKQITVKDFDHFTDHNTMVNEEIDPLMGKNLFSLEGQRWRDMRATLSPSFTGSKMRAMFLLLSECAQQFTKYFEKQAEQTITLEMKDVFTRFTNDAIASVAFGLQVDSLKERDNEFYLMGKTATTFSGVAQTLKFFLFNLSPSLMKYLKITFFPNAVSSFFRRIIKETIVQREEHGLIRPDMIQLLMDARKGVDKYQEEPQGVGDTGFATVQESNVGKVEKHKLNLTDDDITAQALIFFFGGFETSATLMSFIAHELAVNPDVQQKLQKEIDGTLEQCNGKITYDGIIGMKYLDMVVSEVLRKWPPGFQIDRVCTKDYTIMPKTDEEKSLMLKKGQLLLIPIIGIHRNPDYFPNPDRFDPERFSDENKHNIEPATYMPFGAGPRSCIASRFALLENKTLMFHLLSKFDIVPVKRTTIPLVLGTKTFNMMPDGGFWLGLNARSK